MIHSPTLVLAALLAVTPLLAQSPAPGDWAMSTEDFRPLRPVPPGLDLATLDELEYSPRDSVFGATIDLNADGAPDFLIRSAPSLCGASGNCTAVIVDGRSKRPLGTIGGNRFYVRARRINGWPVIQTWWHMSAGSGIYSTYVFDGAGFVQLAGVPVEGDGLESLFKQLDSVPRRRP
jgi:hypothetical protein